MPAPDFTTLLNFETNFETAAKTFLENDTGLAASSIYATLDQDTFVVPRLEVMFETGEGIEPATVQSTNSSQVEYMQNRGVLSIRVVSDASVADTQTTHRQLRAKVRKSMLLNSLNFTTPIIGDITILPFYSVQYMRPTGTTYEVDGDLAVSTMTYEIIFSIKKDAFPVANLRLKTLNESGSVVSVGSPFYSTSTPTLTTSFQTVGKIGLLQGTQTVNVTVVFGGYDISTSDFTIVNASNLQTVQASGEFSFDVDTNSLSPEDNIDIGVFFEN